MNRNLDQLWRMMHHDDEEIMYILNLVHRVDSDAPDLRQIDRDEFSTLHTAVVNFARYVIADFTVGGVFDIDAPARQLGIDTTAEGPTVIDEPAADGSDTHVCTEETIVVDGPYGAPGIGFAAHCATCDKAWSKIGSTFYEAELMAHIATIDDVR